LRFAVGTRLHGWLHDREGLRAGRDAAPAGDVRSADTAPGEAQADFGEALVIVVEVEQKAHYLAIDLPHSDDCFVMAFPAETTEAFLEGTFRPSLFRRRSDPILYDNTRWPSRRFWATAPGRRRRAFSELQSHYLFAEKFGRPAKGNDKGKSKGVGYARRNFMVPIRAVGSWEEWNERLVDSAETPNTPAARARRTIGERFARDGRRFFRCRAARMKPARSNRRESFAVAGALSHR